MKQKVLASTTTLAIFISFLLGGAGLMITAIIILDMSFGPPKQEWLFMLAFLFFVLSIVIFAKSIAYLIWNIADKEE